MEEKVVRLLRDWTEGNTMMKVWRQLKENHAEEYLHRLDLYTTLFMTKVKPGGIVGASGHTFPYSTSSALLLRHAFLLAEAENVQDYRRLLDIFHWMHRFDAAICTESHSKYAMFKSALAGAVLAYNRSDLDRLIQAIRAKNPAAFESVTDEDVVRLYIRREHLKHHVRRVTLVGAGNVRVHPPGH